MHSQSGLHQFITDIIVEVLQSDDLPPWRRPWSNDANALGLATSLSTGRSYKGINQIILQVAASKNKWPSRWFGTFNQIKSAGGSVRKGEKATKVILWKPIQRKRSNEQGKEVDDSFLVMREFAVFNTEQTSGLDKYRVGFSKPQFDPTERCEHADEVIANIGADIRFGGNQAFYDRLNDFIQLPHRTQFESLESFYETAFHELVHYSEHPSRLNWDRENEGYAMSELVAEVGSCQMMAELGLPLSSNLFNHAAYLKSWLTGMENDPKFIFQASSQASRAVDYLLSFSRTTAEQVEIEEPVLA